MQIYTDFSPEAEELTFWAHSNLYFASRDSILLRFCLTGWRESSRPKLQSKRLGSLWSQRRQIDFLFPIIGQVVPGRLQHTSPCLHDARVHDHRGRCRPDIQRHTKQLGPGRKGPRGGSPLRLICLTVKEINMPYAIKSAIAKKDLGLKSCMGCSTAPLCFRRAESEEPSRKSQNASRFKCPS